MDLLEYVAEQLKKGKKTSQIREMLVQNGYPVYEVENALAVAEKEGDANGKKGLKISVNLNAPGYVIILVISVILMIIGIVTLILYFL